MEFSALCTVAAFRGIEFGASLVVSDGVHGSSWQPGFTRNSFKQASRAALDLAEAFIQRSAQPTQNE
jgi:hypothetical protein